MNKVLVVILVLGAGALVYFLLAGNDDDLPESLQVENVTYDEVVEAFEDTGKQTVHGSCNAVAKGSNCIDYVGSVWSDNDMAQLNCEGGGVYSENTCPYSDFGGCQISGGSTMEIVAWTYREGGGGYDEESLPHVKRACDANPMGKWVSSDEQL